MLTNASRFNLEVGSYVLLVAGVIGDHLSTDMGLRRNGIYEANPVVLILLQNNMWLALDLILILFIVSSTHLLVRKIRLPFTNCFVVIPSIVGILRLTVALSNTLLII